MSDIGPGDWVECVDAHTGPWGVPNTLVAGALYKVRAICGGVEPDGSFGYGLKLFGVVGLHLPGMPEGVWRSERFRPIRDGQERIERKVLRRVPA